MANSVSTTGICLYNLPAREEAVLKRVISFSSTQGRNYTLAELQDADLLVLSDDAMVDPTLLKPEGCLLIRIADSTTQMYDVLMQRPLLVTKVMRTLDQANAMRLVAGQPIDLDQAETTADTNLAAVSTSAAVQPLAPVQPVKPPPVPQPVAPVDSTAPAAVEASAPAVAEEAAKPAPAPAMSLYSAILGGGAKSATVPEKPQADAEAASSSSAPFEQNTEAELEPASAHTESNSNDGGQHLALVVDDSAAIRKQLELELRDAGIAAEFAETGEEALEKVAAKRYDLIFLDIIMPGIDGYEACRQMRTKSELKKTPIIMLSAKTSPLDEVQGVIAGASTYLTKPVKSDQFQQTLKRVSMWLDNFQVSV